ncbi:MAG: hypothetical protein FJ095_03590 [Deltaproteobacteria bacterium]|nr:hypothetical protein [Deltaproteobacteria bacterium]
MVEVIMALAVLAVGATGVVAMQKATLLGNTRARDLSTASTVAAAWLDRIKIDALGWRKTSTGGSTVNDTRWLKVIGEDYPQIGGNENVWTRPGVDTVLGYSPGADVRGHDITDAAKLRDAAFCTNVRIVQLLPNMARADVRVFWLRNRGTGVSNTVAGTINGQELCSGDAGYVSKVGESTSRYHFVYMSASVVRAGANL